MTFEFPKWFVAWHLIASLLIALSLVGGVIWSASDRAFLTYCAVMSILMLPMPLSYLFRSRGHNSN